jgi:hypothetical protein
MRHLEMTLLVLGLLGAPAPAMAQEAQSFEPYTAYVSPAGGLRVREEPRAGAAVLITLWQGAKVFVRERSNSYARIDGYGVAGYAFVDERFLTLESPPSAEAPSPPDVGAAPAPASLR